MKAEFTSGKFMRSLIQKWEAQNLNLEVGFFENQTYADSGESVAAVAKANEFGNENTPARPFMRNAFDTNKKKWKRFFENTVKADLPDDISNVLGKTGALMVGDVQKSIRNGGWEPNAPSTIKRKGFDKPLIDTGTMLRSVTWEITNREDEEK